MKKNITFEEALNKLENIVNNLESGKLSLENALLQFEEGIKLARHGQKILQTAEQRVKILTQEDDKKDLKKFNYNKIPKN